MLSEQQQFRRIANNLDKNRQCSKKGREREVRESEAEVFRSLLLRGLRVEALLHWG